MGAAVAISRSRSRQILGPACRGDDARRRCTTSRPHDGLPVRDPPCRRRPSCRSGRRASHCAAPWASSRPCRPVGPAGCRLQPVRLAVRASGRSPGPPRRGSPCRPGHSHRRGRPFMARICAAWFSRVPAISVALRTSAWSRRERCSSTPEESTRPPVATSILKDATSSEIDGTTRRGRARRGSGAWRWSPRRRIPAQRSDPTDEVIRPARCQ